MTDNELADLRRGDLVDCVTAYGDTVTLKAMGPPEYGRDFLVVWVCDEADEWEVPWPAEFVSRSARHR